MTVASTTRRVRGWPYRYAADALDLQLGEISVDPHRDARDAWDAGARRLDLSAARATTARLGVAVPVTASLLAEVLPVDERAAPPVQVVVTVTCGETRLRRAVALTLARDGVARGPVMLAADEVRGAVELTPALVRTTTRMGVDDGLAVDAGSRLASGAPVEVRWDPARPTHGDFLDVRYESFSAKGSPQFPAAGALYRLDCGGDDPVLWINTDHVQVAQVFEATGNVGRAARVRNVLFGHLGYAVWARLFWQAARTVEHADEAALPWQDAVLAHWLKRLYPEARDTESRLQALRDELGQGRHADLEARLDDALQAELDLANAAERLAGELA